MREATKKIVMSTTMRARSTQRVLEMPRRLHECADDDNTGNKTKKTTAAAVAKPLDLNRLGDSRRVRHDAGRPSSFFSARCVIIGPTLILRGIFCVGVVVNHAREVIKAFLCTSQQSYLWLLFWHFNADPRF
jgi:hypothetical protein